MPPVPPQVTRAVQNASPDVVQDAARLLRRDHFPAARWLGTRNRYAVDTVKRIESDAQPGNSPKTSQLSQYVAASVILHCSDGWSFLSHAAASLLDGDLPTAVHLAYYAELRAAMSFLASEGIGVFSRRHCWFDNVGNCQFLGNLNTHQLIWPALEEWAAVPAKSIRLLKLLHVGGRNFADWLQAAGYSPGSPTTSELARVWLESWSLDLREFAEDRDLRNEASYRPQGLRLFQPPTDVVRVLKRLAEFWRACEPSAFERFAALDLHLLRQALERVYTAVGPTRSYPQFVRDTLQQVGMGDQTYLERFLTRSGIPRHPLFVEARKKGRDRSGNMRPISVMARAILLLRLASAACDDLFRRSGIDRLDVEFWLSSMGANIGLWEPGEEPERVTDLWADIETALEVIEQWTDGTTSSNGSISRARRELAFDLWQIQQFQRAGFWAMGL